MHIMTDMINTPNLSEISKFYPDNFITSCFIDYFTIDKIAECSELDMMINMDMLSSQILRGIHVIYEVLNYMLRYKMINYLYETYQGYTKKYYTNRGERVYDIIMTKSVVLPSSVYLYFDDLHDANDFMINMDNMYCEGHRNFEMRAYINHDHYEKESLYVHGCLIEYIEKNSDMTEYTKIYDNMYSMIYDDTLYCINDEQKYKMIEKIKYFDKHIKYEYDLIVVIGKTTDDIKLLEVC